MQLKGETALITGASSGIGAAIAESLAKQGANLALVARRREKLEELKERLDRPEGVAVLEADVTNDQAAERSVQGTVDRFGSVDILINNAGLGTFKQVDELSIEEFDTMVQVNLRAPFVYLKHVLPLMYANQRGAVVTISSLASKNGFAGGGGYCASKFGVRGLTEALFHEARKNHVRTINVMPGSVDTAFFDIAGATPPDRDTILQPEDVAATVMHALTLPDRALVREIDIRPASPRRS